VSIWKRSSRSRRPEDGDLTEVIFVSPEDSLDVRIDPEDITLAFAVIEGSLDGAVDYSNVVEALQASLNPSFWNEIEKRQRPVRVSVTAAPDGLALDNISPTLAACGISESDSVILQVVEIELEGNRRNALLGLAYKSGERLFHVVTGHSLR